jgi:hypothetical protein
MCEQCDKLKERMEVWLKDSRDFMSGMLTRIPEYETLMNKPIEELPLLINDYPDGSPMHHVIKCRLAGKDPEQEDLGRMIELLYDEEFSYDDYKNIGHNDGIVCLLADLFDTLGDKENAQLACEVLYTDQ